MTKEADSDTQMFSDLVQIGVVVKDLDQTIKVLSEVFGLGPFRTLISPPPSRPDLVRTYHGKPAKCVVYQAFTEVGPLELEIIQPLEGENIYFDFLEEHGEGIHHIRFNVPNVAPVIEYLARHGIEVTQSGEGLVPGTTWINFDTEDKVGFSIEILNALPGTDGRTPQIVDGEVQL